MYGAFLGDMIGAPYEFDRGGKTKDFPLFCEASHFTDDTVMTIAVADALLNVGGENEEEIKSEIVRSMRKWGNTYPDAGYGGRFYLWLHSDTPAPYGSYGNGSAMRVSSVGWLYPTLEKTREVARLTAEVTHNHPEGIKGAEATASAIFMARNGNSKEEIREYVIKEFDYDLSRTCDEIRPSYRHNESCQRTVPEAITAFLEGSSFEDVIRTAVSLGGDCDTLTCIAGSIAEAFYGVPAIMEAECKSRLPLDMLDIIYRFDEARGRELVPADDPFLVGNEIIEKAINQFHDNCTKENLALVLDSIRYRMQQGAHFMIPVIPPEAAISMLDIENVKIGDTVTTDEALHFQLQHIQTDDGKTWLVAFTSRKEYEKGESSSIISHFIDVFLKGSIGPSIEAGIILNPWDKPFMLTKELIHIIGQAEKWEEVQ